MLRILLDESIRLCNALMEPLSLRSYSYQMGLISLFFVINQLHHDLGFSFAKYVQLGRSNYIRFMISFVILQPSVNSKQPWFHSKVNKVGDLVLIGFFSLNSAERSAKSRRGCHGRLCKLSTFSGEDYHITLEVKIEDCVTVGDLKKTIAIQQNLSVIALLFRGVPLDDKRQLEKFLLDYRIGPPRFTNHTRVRPRTIQAGVIINVLTLNRKTFQVPLHSFDSTLLELKSAIMDYEGISINHIALTYEGKQLILDHSTLREYKIEPGCTVQLVGRLLGGGCGEVNLAPELPQAMLFADMESTSLLERIRLQPHIAQQWRTCEEGLNVEGECWNDKCEAYRQIVICPLNFAVFNLEEEIKCPCCIIVIGAITCGSYKCLWMFKGRFRVR